MPFLLILVSDWSQAQTTYDVCYELMAYYRKRIHVEVIYGGRDGSVDKNVQLLNGCEILISTVPFLNKMVDGGFTNLNRCCHIVFDNADFLVEHYTEDIKVLMHSYAILIKKRKRLDAPRQLIAMGTKWSHGIVSLIDSYFTDPIVVIDNKVEASLFANVRQIVEVCKSDDRMDAVLLYLETDASSHNTVIFTQSAADAEKLAQYLMRFSIAATVVTEFTAPTEVKDIRLGWNADWVKKSNVLVMSDGAATKLDIRNASCVINFDFPPKKSIFGNRMGMLLESMRSNEGKEEPQDLISHIFITEKNCARFTSGLIKLLKRAGQDIPPSLASMGASTKEIKEEEKKYCDLCEKLKLFGECSYRDDCFERHTVFPDVDLLNMVPATGIVKVVVLDIISASSYWCRILQHRIPYDNKAVTYDTSVYLQVAMDMQIYYANPMNRKRFLSPKLFDCCAVRLKDGYQRVRVEAIIERDHSSTSGLPYSVSVFGIDNGLTTSVLVSDLLICPEEILAIPPQAVEVIVCSVRPVDKSMNWTIDASVAMEKMLLGKTLEGRVQFSLRNTVWVDPLVEKQKLEGVNIVTSVLNVGSELINQGFGVKNAKHSENFRKILHDVQGYSKINMRMLKSSRGLPVGIDHDCSYLQDDDYEDVVVSSVTHPGLFYVQRLSSCDDVDKLDDKIDATMQVKTIEPEDLIKILPIGYIGVAQFSADNRWYRAKILDISEDRSQYDVYYVDHGDREWRPRAKVQQSWPDILRLPFQAIECSFRNISPVGKEWSSEDGDALWDLVSEKLLTVKVLDTDVSDHIPETIFYSVEMYDTSTDVTVNVSHELVYMGIAQGSQQCLQDMFPYANKMDEVPIYKNPCQQVADLCLHVHQAQDHESKFHLCSQMQKLLELHRNDTVGLVEFGAVHSLCKLLALIRTDTLQELVVQCLMIAVSKIKSAYKIVVEEGGIRAICNILDKSSTDSLKEACLLALASFGQDELYQNSVLEHGGICAMCKLLQATDNSKVKQKIFKVFVSVCTNNDRNCGAVRHEGGLEAICDILEHSKDMELTRSAAGTLPVLLTHARNQEKIREIGGLTVLASLVNKELSEMALKEVLLSLQAAVGENEINRDYVHKLGAHVNIKRCSEIPVRRSVAVRQLFTALINRITPAPIMEFEITGPELPPISEITGVKLTGLSKDISLLNLDGPTGLEKKVPRVQWSQRKNTVTLSVKLRGVQRERTVLHDERVHFRTVLDEVEYEFDIELYRPICQKESRVLVKGGEILLTLRKLELGEIWPRLLKSLEKPSYIGMDFDRWVDEFPTEEEEGDVDEGPRLFMSGLPPPPKCTAYEGDVRPTAIDLNSGNSDMSSSSDDDNASDDDVRQEAGERRHPEYFNL